VHVLIFKIKGENMTTTQTILNGLNTDELSECIETLGADHSQGAYQFRAINKWVNGAQCQTSIRDYSIVGLTVCRQRTHELISDEPVGLLGEDAGPNATEALLHALASCLSTSFIYHATARGVKIEQLELCLEGNIDINGFLGTDDSVRNGFSDIKVTCKVKSEASQERIEELLQIAQDRSPVFDCVTHEVPVTVLLA
jgi:uncharacterized OsmC-like protein